MLVVGAGGLGAPVIFYLAAAGIGHITIFDDDMVSRTDLNRKIIYREEDFGAAKQARGKAAQAINPAFKYFPPPDQRQCKEFGPPYVL
ncbi:MAG: hypothetical protein CM15mP46_1190 [Alphaproteobacteria bacterium]|nr:MAG: hypothetical protein CM15mP46_1190 [Alphaproteobacteria bacterium]